MSTNSIELFPSLTKASTSGAQHGTTTTATLTTSSSTFNDSDGVWTGNITKLHNDNTLVQQRILSRESILQRDNSIVSMAVLYTRNNSFIVPNLQNGTIIDIGTMLDRFGRSTDLTIIATAGTKTAIVRFVFDNNTLTPRIDRERPYVLCGNRDTKYYNCPSMTIGTHSVTATPYNGTQATRNAGPTYHVTFHIVNSKAVTAVPAVPIAAPSAEPSSDPSAAPNSISSVAPSSTPTSVPAVPIAAPSAEPSSDPSDAPNSISNVAPSSIPSSVRMPVVAPIPVPPPILVIVPPTEPTQPVVGSPVTPEVVVRINAGSTSPWTDPITGYIWDEDKYYSGGGTFGTGTCPTNIEDTLTDTLFCTERNFDGTGGSYNIPLPGGKSYEVTLQFAEIFYEDEGRRVFDVIIQSRHVQSSLDLVYVVGAKVVHTVRSTVGVTSDDPTNINGIGYLNIAFVNIVEKSKINAIEIVEYNPDLPSPPVSAPTVPTSNFDALRINAGSDQNWTDPSTGNVWMADKYSSAGSTFGQSVCNNDVTYTPLDILFCTERFFDGPPQTKSTYSIPIPEGTYVVNLLFAETFWWDVNQRVFDVYVQNQSRYSALDLVRVARPNTAYTLSTMVNVTRPSNGGIRTRLRIEFVNRVNNAKINAIEILPSAIGAPFLAPTSAPTLAAPTPTPSTYRINAGSASNWTDPNTGTDWSADKYFIGGATWSSSQCLERPSIGRTEIDYVFCSERTFGGPAGSKGSYDIPVPPGRYLIKLLFAEIFFTSKNSRVFNIFIQGSLIKSNFDIIDVTGGVNRAYTLSSVVNVTSSILIEFENVVENTKVSAIEITPFDGTTPPDNTLSSLPTSYRINAGSSIEWTDPITSLTWESDFHYTGGFPITFDLMSIADTEMDFVFCSERIFEGPPGSKGGYILPIRPGKYTVNLYFAEMYFDTAELRMFHIYVQNQSVERFLDLVQIVGPKTAFVVSTIVDVVPDTSGNSSIKIDFENDQNNAKISAIEVLPYIATPTLAPVRSPSEISNTIAPTLTKIQEIRINCGYDDYYIDELGHTWVPDQHYVGGTNETNIVPITNTNDDPLYHYYRTGAAFIYEIPVKLATYEVNLLFAETEFTQSGQRVFNVKVENTVRLNIDLLAVTSPGSSTRLQFFELVEDGFLTIELTQSTAVNTSIPKLNAIEMKLDKPHFAHAVASGPYFGTIVDTSGKAKIRLIGETSHTHAVGKSIIEYKWVEDGEVLGTTPNLNANFTAGNHLVSLTIKDDGDNMSTETTTVTIKPLGYAAITELLPTSGSLVGNFVVTLKGSGFNYSASETTVFFGQTELTGVGNIDIIDFNTIQIVAPASAFAQAVYVYVQTPLGLSEPIEFNYVGSIPIQWESQNFFTCLQPTVGRFGPDQKLYVGTAGGIIYKLTMNDYFTTVVDAVEVQVSPVGESILGIAFDPLDDKPNPDVYFTSQIFFHKGSTSSGGISVNGKIRRASGENLETVVTIISGLPISDHDHGLNAMEFGDQGELYFTIGSNTNGGVPGPLSASKALKENFLSAAVNVAYIFHQEFNGAIQWSAVDDGNMIATGIDVFAHGLRNPYGLVLHSNGNLYATDNGPNFNYGRMMIGCGPNQDVDDIQTDDELLLVQKGHYYGHPNPKRAQYFNDTRQCVYRSPATPSDSEYTAPIIRMASSRDGIMEFHGSHFGGQLRGNLIMVKYGASEGLSRVILSDDGTRLSPSSRSMIPMRIGNMGLDITQAPNGNIIEVRFSINQLGYIKPLEPSTSDLVVKTVFPRRGSYAGGTPLSIYGVNFNSTGITPNITVGGVPCPPISISSTVMTCTLPGGFGTVDVIVTNGIASSTFERAYRYVTGILPVDFQIPRYT